MSISGITPQIQNAEQYKIRSSKSEKVQQESQSSQQVQQVKTDEYDKANPVGESAEGIYSVSHDDEGKLKVNYTQPAEKSPKSESKTESKSESKAESSNEQDKAGGASPSAGAASATESDDDEEIERLKKQRDALKAQLNRESDEEVKQALRVQLQNIEAQIAMKSTGLN